MQEEQQKVYLSYLAKARKEINDEIKANGFESSQIKILALLMRLRQICCHPKLFLQNYDGESSKLIQCVELIKIQLKVVIKYYCFQVILQCLK